MNAMRIVIAVAILSLAACEEKPASSAANEVSSPRAGAGAAAPVAPRDPQPPDTGAATPAPTPPDNVDQATAPAAPLVKLNLNTASGDEFRTIPNVGNRMVHEFEEYRPYVSIQQFRREIAKYVSAEQVAEYEKYVFVPIAPDECDAETLQQIPGVDVELAEQLIASRPFGSNEAFLKSVSPYLDAAQLAVAETYLATPPPSVPPTP